MQTDIYREPMIGTGYIARELKCSTRHARRLVTEHPEGVTDGYRWVIPARCLHQLKPRKPMGRPRKKKT